MPQVNRGAIKAPSIARTSIRCPRAGRLDQIRLPARPRSRKTVACQAKLQAKAGPNRSASNMTPLLSTLLVDHLPERSEVQVAQLFILEQVLEQEQRIAAKDAVDECAEGRRTCLAPASRRQVNVASPLGPVQKPAGFLQLLHHRENRRVGRLRLALEAITYLSDR